MTDPRHHAWDGIRDLLPTGWQVGPASFSHDPSNPVWRVAAHGPLRGRRKPPETIEPEGEDEIAALTELALALREYGKPDHMALSSGGPGWPTTGARRTRPTRRRASR